jgi:hypothetical protein
MNRKKLSKLIIKKIFKGIVDTMIPVSNDKAMPKATNAINLKKFLENIRKNKKLNNKIHSKILINLQNNKNKNLDYFKLGKKIAKLKIIEDDIEKYLLEEYFTSKSVRKQLLKKTNKSLPRKKTFSEEKFLILKLLKKKRLRYKYI